MSVSLHGPAILKSALQRLDELSRLEHDWDSYGALPLTPTALEVAESIMRRAVELFERTYRDRAAPYVVMPIADGGVSIEWRGRGASLELDIGPSGMLSFLSIEGSGDTRRFEEGSEITVQQALDLVRRVLGS